MVLACAMPTCWPHSPFADGRRTSGAEAARRVGVAPSTVRAWVVAMLHEFDVSPEQGLSRAQASAAFKKPGLDPRSFGSWVMGGYVARVDDRRWLTNKGSEWADPSPDEQLKHETWSASCYPSRHCGGWRVGNGPVPHWRANLSGRDPLTDACGRRWA